MLHSAPSSVPHPDPHWKKQLLLARDEWHDLQTQLGVISPRVTHDHDRAVVEYLAHQLGRLYTPIQNYLQAIDHQESLLVAQLQDETALLLQLRRTAPKQAAHHAFQEEITSLERELTALRSVLCGLLVRLL